MSQMSVKNYETPVLRKTFSGLDITSCTLSITILQLLELFKAFDVVLFYKSYCYCAACPRCSVQYYEVYV